MSIVNFENNHTNNSFISSKITDNHKYEIKNNNNHAGNNLSFNSNNTDNNHNYHNNECNGIKTIMEVKIAIIKRMSMKIKLNSFLLKKSIQIIETL